MSRAKAQPIFNQEIQVFELAAGRSLNAAAPDYAVMRDDHPTIAVHGGAIDREICSASRRTTQREYMPDSFATCQNFLAQWLTYLGVRVFNY